MLMERTDDSSGAMRARIFSKNDDVVSRRITDEMFLIPVRGKLADMQRIFTLDPVAEFIWREIDGTSTVGDICSRLAGEFEVDEETSCRDTEEFIEELLKANLISERN